MITAVAVVIKTDAVGMMVMIAVMLKGMIMIVFMLMIMRNGMERLTQKKDQRQSHNMPRPTTQR